MDMGVLQNEMESYGHIRRWVMPPGPVHVYAVYETKEMASAAMAGLREHRRLIVEMTDIYY